MNVIDLLSRIRLNISRRFTVQGKTGPEHIDLSVGKVSGGVGFELKSDHIDPEYHFGRLLLPLDWFSRLMSEGPWWWEWYRRWRNLDPRKENVDTKKDEQ